MWVTPLLRSTLFPLAGLLLVSGGALAQAGGAPDLNVLALEWARGQYGSPLVCDLEGSPVRAIRRVLIAPVPPTEAGRTAANRVLFPDPTAKGASRCFSELGADEPLVDGSLVISLPGRSRPDTARYDFQTALRRDDGFRFEVRSGRLLLKGWGPGNEEPAPVDFSGGTASLRQVRPGSDPERLLRGFKSPRKLLLELEAPDGTKLRFPLFQAAER